MKRNKEQALKYDEENELQSKQEIDELRAEVKKLRSEKQAWKHADQQSKQAINSQMMLVDA